IPARVEQVGEEDGAPTGGRVQSAGLIRVIDAIDRAPEGAVDLAACRGHEFVEDRPQRRQAPSRSRSANASTRSRIACQSSAVPSSVISGMPQTYVRRQRWTKRCSASSSTISDAAFSVGPVVENAAATRSWVGPKCARIWAENAAKTSGQGLS